MAGLETSLPPFTVDSVILRQRYVALAALRSIFFFLICALAMIHHLGGATPAASLNPGWLSSAFIVTEGLELTLFHAFCP